MTTAADEVKYYKLCRDIETDERVLVGPDDEDAPGGYYVRSLDHDRIVSALRQQLEQANKDAARWREIESRICHSFDGQDRTYYFRVKGRTEFADAIDAALSQEGAKE